MQTTSSDYKLEIKKPSRSFECKITIGNNIYFNDDIVDITLETIQPNEGYSIGNTTSQTLDLTLINKGDIIYSASQIKLEIGLRVGSTIEYILMGYYNIDEVEKTDYTTKITAFDNMIKFETSYFSSLGDTATLQQIVNELANKTGVQFTGSLPAYTVKKLEGFTCREVLGYVASLCGGNAHITRDGKFTIIVPKEVDYSITGDNYFDYKREEIKYKIDKISCKADDKEFTKGTLGTDSMELQFENPWVTDVILTDIYNKLNGFSYLGYTMKWQGDLSLDPGDIVSVTDIKGVLRKVPILSQKSTYTGGLTCEIGAKGESKNKNSFNSSGSGSNKLDRVVTELLLVKEALIDKANIQELEAVQIRTQTLEAKTATIEKAIIDVAHISDLNAINAKIDNLVAEDVKINNALIDKATVGELNVLSAKIVTMEVSVGKIDSLEANIAEIKTLVNGNLTSDNIHSLVLTADKVTVENGFIKNAMIDNLDVSKINAGDISTNKFRIVSDSGRMVIADNTIQIADTKRVRVQIGKDASNDYNMYVWDAAGKLMFDATGLKSDGIKSKIIRDDMISDTANISGTKLNISSVVTSINNGTTTINSSKVLLDGTSQTLNVAFNSLNTTVKGTVKSVDVMYYLSTSQTLLAGGSWSTIAPTWVEGKYMWSKTVTTLANGTANESQPTCIAGAKGSTGSPGAAGKGVKSIVEQYYHSTSNTTQVGGSWTTTTPIWTQDKYIWTRSIVTYSDNTTTTTEPICASGGKGDTGLPGTNGISITSVDIWYYLSTSNTTQIGGVWSTNVPAWVNGKYMWSKTITSLSNGTTKETLPVCITGGKGNDGLPGATGAPGANGKGVTSITEEYYLSTSKTTQTGGSWVTTPPTWSKGKYIWTRSKIIYNNPTSTEYTTPICDNSWEAVNEVADIVTSQTTAINAQQGKIDALIANTTIVKDGVTTQLKDAYNATVIKVNSMQSTIGNHTTQINDVTGKVTGVETKVNDVKRDLDGTVSIVSGHTSQINGLNSTVSTQGSSISQLQNQIKLKVESSEVSNIAQTVVNGVEIGDRNLLKGSGTSVTTSNYNIKDYYFGDVKPVEGETYTIVMKATLGAGKTYFGFYNSGGNVSPGSVYNPDSDGLYRKTLIWRVGTSANSFLRVYHMQSSVVVDSTIEWIKLVKGNKTSSIWTAATEDIDASIDGVYDNISKVESEITQKYEAAIKIAEGNITNSISEMYTTKNEFGEFVSGEFSNIKQDVNSVRTEIGSVETRVEEVNGELVNYQTLVATYMQFTEIGLEIGKTNSKFRALLDNEKLAFAQDNTIVSYISNNKMYITDAEILGRLTVGQAPLGFWDWSQRSNGNFGLQWRAQ